jgi:hypothetical protein
MNVAVQTVTSVQVFRDMNPNLAFALRAMLGVVR